MAKSLVLLAAGKSERMGEPKIFLRIQNKNFIEYQIEQIKNAFSDIQIFVVTRSEFQKQVEALFQNQKQVVVLENPLAESEIFQSAIIGLKAALDSGRYESEGVYLTPVDTPISSKVLSEIQKYISESGGLKKKASCLPQYQGRHGHPIWISHELVKDFLANPERLDQFLKRYPRQSVRVTGSACTLNINTPSEWQRFLSTLPFNESVT